MRLFDAAMPLYDAEPESGGGGPSSTIDPGAPFVHGETPAKPAAKTAEKSDIEKRLEALERDNESLKKRNDELTESERYWATRARGGDRSADEDAGEDYDPDPEIAPARAAAHEDEKPEALLDDLSATGLKALKARGIITEEELERRLDKIREQTERRIQTAEADASWAARFAQEFPEIAEDNARMNRGEKPQHELFRRASAIFREMVADDPSVAKSQGALMAAARAAKREIAAEKKAMENDRQERRSRIDAQRPERDRATNGDEPEEPHVSKLGQQVIGHLARFGVTQDSYVEHQGPENRNGMKHVGGRRG